MGVFGGKLGDLASEGGALFHTLIDEVDAVAVFPFHSFKERGHLIFFADILFCPLNGNAVVESEGFDPGLIILGPLSQKVLSHGRSAHDVSEKVDHVFWSGEHGQIAVDDDPIKTVINKNQHPGKKFVEQFHRRSSLMILFGKSNHPLDRRWMQEGTAEGSIRVARSSYP